MQSTTETNLPPNHSVLLKKESPEQILQRLIAAHKGKLASSFEELLGDGGMPDETADDINKAIRQWRDFSLEKDVE